MVKQKIPDFRKRLSSFGVNVVIPRDIAKMRVGNLTKSRISRISAAERRMRQLEVIKNKEGRQVNVVNHGSLMLPGVAQALEKAKDIKSSVAQGKYKVSALANPNLRAFFSSAEIKEMFNYLRNRRHHMAKEKMAKILIARGEKGVFVQKDVLLLKKVFEVDEANKFIIAYNDKITLLGLKEKRLKESRDIKGLRKRINFHTVERSRHRSMLKLFRSLDARKFPSELAFKNALRKISPKALERFERIGTYDKPFIIQYAVGNNASINSPYSNQGKILDTYNTDKCKVHVIDVIKGLKKSIAKEANNIRYARSG
ncbi:MAG: hypothetical protein WCI04_03655 [archaeon]